MHTQTRYVSNSLTCDTRRPTCIFKCHRYFVVLLRPIVHLVFRSLRATFLYDTIRDAILTCARKPTIVSLIYHILLSCVSSILLSCVTVPQQAENAVGICLTVCWLLQFSYWMHNTCIEVIGRFSDSCWYQFVLLCSQWRCLRSEFSCCWCSLDAFCQHVSLLAVVLF